MPKVQCSAINRYSVDQMFELVDDIETYPAFLPWCVGAKVWQRKEGKVKASIDIKKGGIKQAFTTLNCQKQGELIEMTLVDGPFSNLHGFWRFKALGESGCKVSLELEYKFSSKMLSLTFGPIFNQIANSLVDAFTKRAEQLYG